KLVAGQETDESVKSEMVSMLLDTSTGSSKIPSNIKLINNIITTSVPRSVGELKDIRTKLATSLVENAKTRLADKTPVSETEVAAARKTKQSKIQTQTDGQVEV